VGRARPSETVEQDPHRHARLRAVEQRGHDRVVHLPLLPDVAAEVHALACAADRDVERGEELVAVVEEPGRAALPQRSPRGAGDGEQEVLRIDGRGSR
jgi:hypothetical protein